MKSPCTPTRMARLAAACGACLLALTLGACSSPQKTGDQSLATTVEEGSVPSADSAPSVSELIAQRAEKGSLVPTSSGAATGAQDDGLYNGVDLQAQDGVPAKPKTKKWTVMVYIIGANLESEGGQASMDIDEMGVAGVDFSQANVLYLTGGSYSWEKDIPNNRNVVWDLETGEAVGISAANSMGDPATLSSFINFADQYYPAEHTALFFWDHGGGPVLGFGEDEVADGDGLLLPEMASAMQATRYVNDTRLDIVGFDACLMGTIETANVWRDHADWFIGSEEVEAGLGWDWGFLAVLNDQPKASEVCEAVVRKFESSYRLLDLFGMQQDYTLAAYDLSVSPEVTAAVDELAEALSYDVNAGDYSKINFARDNTTQFGVVNVRGQVVCYDLFDLAGFADQFGSTLPAEAGKVNEAVDRMVVYQASNIDGTHGVSIYFPASTRDLWEMAGTMMGTPMGEAYRALTASYARRWETETAIDWSLTGLDINRAPAEAALSPDGTEYLVPLSEEQVESLDHASYVVLSFADGSYRHVMREVRVKPDEEGVLHVPVDPEVVVLAVEGLDTPVPLVAQQVPAGNRTRFICPSVKLFAEAAEGEDAGTSVDVSLVFDRGDDGTLTLVAAPLVQDDVTGSRANAVLTDYAALSSLLGYAITPTRDDASELLPSAQWDSVADSEFAYAWASLGDGVSFEMQPSSALGLDVACQVILTDQSGAQHATELFELAAGASASK